MIYKILQYFKNYPGFAGKRLAIDYIGPDKNVVSFIPDGMSEVTRTYTDGGKIMRYTFRVVFLSDYKVTENSAYLITEGIKRYINENPPDFDGGLYFEVTEFCHIAENTGTKGKYEMKLKYVYEVKE